MVSFVKNIVYKIKGPNFLKLNIYSIKNEYFIWVKLKFSVVSFSLYRNTLTDSLARELWALSRNSLELRLTRYKLKYFMFPSHNDKYTGNKKAFHYLLSNWQLLSITLGI